MAVIPYKNHINLVVNLQDLQHMDVVQNDATETKEKVYAYATFMPPGRSNSCILYNTDSQSKS